MLLRSAALLLLMGSAAANAAPRAPTEKWVVNFDDAQCIASRAYGSAETPLHLVLKSPPVGDVMQVAIMRKGHNGAPAQIDASIVIDAQNPLRTNMLSFGPRDSRFRVYTINLSSEASSRLRGAKSLAIRSSGLDQEFALSQMQVLLKTMQQCVADLRQVWNVTSADGEQSSLKQRARADLSRYIRSEDYPAVAIRSETEGLVKFAILVNEAGRIADCTVTGTSGVAALDAQTCVIMKERAKFEPAIGMDGKPAKDAKVASVRWVIP